MPRQFIAKYPDGRISLIYVVDASTNEEILAKSPTYASVVSNRDITEQDLIPAEYSMLREAFTDDGSGNIKIDMVKAKEIILEELRQKRNAKLDDLDRLDFKAQGTNDNILNASVQQDKQTLRDCTETMKNISVSGYSNYAVLDQLIAANVLPATNN